MSLPMISISDLDRLTAYLRNIHPSFSGDLSIRQLEGGQSNPTFALIYEHRTFVLRKKPPGPLLPSAHAIEREFDVLRALAETRVPVPIAYHFCREKSVLGQEFYIMEHVEGRVYDDLLATDIDPYGRKSVMLGLAKVLADLHSVDFRATGLEKFGKSQGYLERQIGRWSKQYQASRFEDPAMCSLMRWLPDHIPPGDECALTHGDYRLGNVIVNPHDWRIAAVLDWELATLGHPLADLAYSCLVYRLPREVGHGIADVDIRDSGLPTEEEYVSAYCARAGRSEIERFEFYIAFALFRAAAITAGVYRRGLDGTATDRDALNVGSNYRLMAELGWRSAQAC